jgi:hypothetical protein
MGAAPYELLRLSTLYRLVILVILASMMGQKPYPRYQHCTFTWDGV